jgi:hypothetical protein
LYQYSPHDVWLCLYDSPYAVVDCNIPYQDAASAAVCVYIGEHIEAVLAHPKTIELFGSQGWSRKHA